MDKKSLHEFFEYRNGELFWKKKTSKYSHIKIGDKAGSIDSKGYAQVRCGGGKVLMHRIIFLMHHGWMPKILDHIDGNKLNNKIENLRPATPSQNGHHSKNSKNNTSGVKGVTWSDQRNKWCARIFQNRKLVFIGFFNDVSEAAIAIALARESLVGEFARHA